MRVHTVKSMQSPKGNDVPHQHIVTDNDGVYFVSYGTLIALKTNEGKIVLSLDWDYSRTTGRYRNLFLGEPKRVTEAKIKSGEYILVDQL